MDTETSPRLWTLQCTVCGAEQRPTIEEIEALGVTGEGWPTCCGEIMGLCADLIEPMRITQAISSDRQKLLDI